MPFTDTSSLDDASEALLYSFPQVRLARGESRRGFRLRYRRAELGSITCTRLAVDGELITSGVFPDHIAVGRRRRGGVDIRYGGEVIDTGGSYLRPPGDSDARFTNSDVELLILERDRFEAVARRHLAGTGRRLLAPTFETSSPTTVAAGRLWRSASQVISEHVAHPVSALRIDALHELAVASVLSCFALSAEESTPSTPGYRPRAVIRAMEFIDEHLAEPVTVMAIADAARMSVRGVQSAFRRELGISPMRYLRRARLNAARVDLERLDPSTASVAQIAQRWGFDHPARFAAQFRERFGSNPSEILRR